MRPAAGTMGWTIDKSWLDSQHGRRIQTWTGAHWASYWMDMKALRPPPPLGVKRSVPWLQYSLHGTEWFFYVMEANWWFLWAKISIFRCDSTNFRLVQIATFRKYLPYSSLWKKQWHQVTHIQGNLIVNIPNHTALSQQNFRNSHNLHDLKFCRVFAFLYTLLLKEHPSRRF